MKSLLTENGVLSLYNQGSQTNVKVQVLFCTHLNKASFLRVTDSKHLSPVMVILKVMENFFVGDILLIKKVQLQSCGILKEAEYLPLVDIDLSHLFILEYQVAESRKTVGVLYTAPPTISLENTYLNSLVTIKHYLFKGEGMADGYFKELEKRLAILRPDSNLLRERGNELYKKENYVKAILHYDMAKQKDQYDPRVWNNSSQAYFFNNEYDRAKQDAFVALKLDPFNKKAYYRAGQALEKESNLQAAIEVVEAGLYICGKCDDLEKLYRQIKENLKLTSVTKNIENKPTIIMSPSEPSNVSKNELHLPNGNVPNSTKILKNNKDSPLRFLEKKLMVDAEDNDKYWKKSNNQKNHIKLSVNTENAFLNAPLLSLLEGARMLYEKGKYQFSLELYDASVSSKNDYNSLLTEKELTIIRYLIDVCKIKTAAYDMDLIRNSLSKLLDKAKFCFMPAVHFWLAKTYEISDKLDKVVHHANNCILLIDSYAEYNLFWPGTKDPISETSPETLKKWFNNGTWRSSPFATCRHIDCLSIQGHNLAKTQIYKSDLDFRGYVEVECEEVCLICYHPCCWKAIKECMEEGQPGKKIDKDFLGMQCFTPDCSGKICSIRIFDENCQLRNEIVKDKKDKKNLSVKPKKKKEKKKPLMSQVGKYEDRKKRKLTEPGDNKLENDMLLQVQDAEPMKQHHENRNTRGTIPVKPLPPPLDFDKSSYKVLQPGNSAFKELQINEKAKNKKKKKTKLNQINILADDGDHKISNNDYLNRLKALKHQRDAIENEQSSFTDNGDSLHKFKFLPDCILDPDDPFYLPRHLQENPVVLESFLQPKLLTSSLEIETETVNTLLEFTYDWLKTQSPMSISDPRLSEFISDNFPPNALAYIKKGRGIHNFLLQSFKFALIDDVICVSDHVLLAQDMVIKNSIDNIKSRCLISDGHKAASLSHFLDDANSSLHHAATSAFSEVVPLSKPLSSITCKATSLNMASSQSDKNTDIISKLIRPKPQPTLGITTKTSSHETAMKPRFNIMDVDAFEVIDDEEMNQLFSPLQRSDDKKCGVGTSDSEIVNEDSLFQSDDEMEDDMSDLNKIIAPGKNCLGPKELGRLSKLEEELALRNGEMAKLEEELALRNAEVAKLAEEKQQLTTKNQHLQDRASQIKIKTSVEISALKKSSQEAQELTKIAESNFESYKSQKEGEIRKFQDEKMKNQEELKTCALKIDSLQLTIDKLRSTEARYEEEAKQKSIQLTEQQIQHQNAASRLEERAKDVEFKYVTMKTELIKSHLEATKQRLLVEVDRMRVLLPDATGETSPNNSDLLQCIAYWEGVITKINTASQTLLDDCQQFLDDIHRSRPLTSFLSNDWKVPLIPDNLTLAIILHVGKSVSPSINKASDASKLLHGFSSNFPGVISGCIKSAVDGLPSENFNLGQLGVAAMSKKENIESSRAIESSSSSPTHRVCELGNFPTSRMRRSPLLELPYTPRLYDDPFRMPMPFETDYRVGFGRGRLNDPQINRRFTMKNKAESLIPSFNADLMAPFSDRRGELSSYGMGPPSTSNDNQLFVGQLPWNFTEEQLRTVFSKYGTVVSSTIHNKGQTSEGKPVPKYGFVTFRSKQERDNALMAGPISFGNHTLNIQAREFKRGTKMSVPLDPIPDLPLMPRSASVSSLSAPPVSKPPTSSAFGLQSLLDASKQATPRNVAASVTPTPKPKFQNLKSIGTVGAVGTLPPKVVRPIPRAGSSILTRGPCRISAPSKEDTFTNSAPYKRLIEECKQKFGSNYPEESLHKAIKQVREQNKNSLSGLALETIFEQVEVHLKDGNRSSMISIAPWAQLTQETQETQECRIASFDQRFDDDCAICMERLSSSPTMSLGCGHMFHDKCIKNWLMKKSDCPLCRKFTINSDEFPYLQ